MTVVPRPYEAEQSIQRTGSSRSAQSRSVRQWRLAPAADAWRSAGLHI